MSVPTTAAAYVQYCKGWEEKHREHPAYDWMWDFNDDFDEGDMRKGSYPRWLTSDFVFAKSDGTTFAPGAASWAAVIEQYALFVGQHHEPAFLNIWETPSGYEMVGRAKLFANLPGTVEHSQEDLRGRKWDVGMPAMFHFVYVKDTDGHKGLKLGSFRLFGDPSPLLGQLLKTGLASGEQLLAQIGQ